MARLLPRGEAAVHFAYGLEPHLLGDVGGQGRSPGAVAEEDELFPGGEDLLVVGALRIDPELEHAAGAVEGTGDDALPFELADVSQVDKDHVVAAVAGAGLVQADGPNPRFRLVDHLAEPFTQLHLFEPSSRGARACGSSAAPHLENQLQSTPLGVRSHNVTRVPRKAISDGF